MAEANQTPAPDANAQPEVETQEGAPQQPPEEEAAPEEAEAKGEGEEGAEEGEEEAAEGDEDKPDDAPKPEDKQKRKTGFRRQIERLERQVAEKDAMMAQLLARMPQPGQPEGDKPKAPEQKAAEYIANLVNEGVQKALAEKEKHAAAQRLAQKWEEQLPEDEEEAYEVRAAMQYAFNLKAGPVREAILTSEIAPRIMGELQRNPRELARIGALPEVEQAREILRLEAKLAAGAAPAKTPKPVVRPPAPPSKVGGTAAKSTRATEDLPMSDYKRAMRSRGR